jgi:hypothetical protein
MKHLLNDMSSEEKNSILEQHTGGIKIDTSRFRSLLESTLGNAKPLVSEQVTTGSTKPTVYTSTSDMEEMPDVAREVNEEEMDDEVVVNVNDIAQEDMKCFSDVSAEEALKVGLNHGGRYKVKKKGCSTTTRYKGPTQKSYGRRMPGM